MTDIRHDGVPQRRPFWCALSGVTRREFLAGSYVYEYPAKTVLISQGQEQTALFIVCSGLIELSSRSRTGKSVIIRIIRNGDVVGLSALMSDAVSEVTAQTMTPVVARFAPAEEFKRLILKHGDLAVRVACILSEECRAACREIRLLALSPSSASRVASVLLSISSGQRARSGPELVIDTRFSHEQIAEMSGTSRETVTRVLSRFKRDRIIGMRGSMLVIEDLSALDALAFDGAGQPRTSQRPPRPNAFKSPVLQIMPDRSSAAISIGNRDSSATGTRHSR